MVNIGLKVVPKPFSYPKVQLKGYPDMGKFMGLPDDKFGKVVSELEKSALFQFLKARKIITFSGIQKLTDEQKKIVLTKSKEDGDLIDIFNFIPAQEAFDEESFIADYPDIVSLIKRVGKDQFVKILHSDDDSALELLFDKYNLSKNEREQFVDCINDFQFKDSMNSQITKAAFSQKLMGSQRQSIFRKDKCIGAIKHVNEKFILEFDTVYERKKYKIHVGKIAQLKEDFDRETKAKLKNILAIIEFINMRKTTICYVMEIICEAQKDYLVSGGVRPLKPLTQKYISKIINVYPSTINRVIKERKIYTPWGEPIPIRNLFATKDSLRKEWVKKVLAEIVKRENSLRPYSDEIMRCKLKKLFNIAISREAIKQYRKELKIPASCRRKLIKRKQTRH